MKEKLEIIINIINQLNIINGQLAEKASVLEKENKSLKEENNRLTSTVGEMKKTLDEFERKYSSDVESIKKCNNYLTEKYNSLLIEYKKLNVNLTTDYDNYKKHMQKTIDELTAKLNSKIQENENTPEYTEEISGSPRHEKPLKRNAPQDINC